MLREMSRYGSSHYNSADNSLLTWRVAKAELPSEQLVVIYIAYL
jgi:hypothetical protein